MSCFHQRLNQGESRDSADTPTEEGRGTLPSVDYLRKSGVSDDSTDTLTDGSRVNSAICELSADVQNIQGFRGYSDRGG